MSSKKTDRLINIFPKYFWITHVLNVSLQFFSILFNSQTCQKGNSPLALRPLRKSYQVLLYPIKQKWYQTYSRLKHLLSYENDFYCLLYCNTKWSLLSQLFIFISNISSKEEVWCDTSSVKFFFSFNFSVRILLRYF